MVVASVAERVGVLIVVEAWMAPETCNGPATVEEPVIIAPFPTVSIPVVDALVKVVTPVTLRVPVAVILAKEAKPLTRKVLEAFNPSFIQTGIVVVGVKLRTPKLSCWFQSKETPPLPQPTQLPTVIVPVAVRFAKLRFPENKLLP